MSPRAGHLPEGVHPQTMCSGRERGHGRRSSQEQHTTDPRTCTLIKLFAEAITPLLLAGPSK